MKGRIKSIALSSLAIGFILGALATWFSVSLLTKKQFEKSYTFELYDFAYTGLQIKKGQTKEWVAGFEANLPMFVTVLDKDFRDTPGATEALWMFKEYVAVSDMEVTESTKNILDSLPEKPPTSCQLKLRELESKNGEQGVTGQPEER